MRKTEGKFRSVAEVAQDAIIMIDADDVVTYWNPAAERIFGYTAAEASGRKIHGWLAPKRYRAAAAAGLVEFAKTGRGAAVGKTLELAALRKDGVEIPIELSLAATRIAGGWRAIGIARDISERKRADDAVRDQLHFIERLLATVPSPVFATDSEGRYIRFNRAYEAFLGMKAADILGKSAFDLWPPELAKTYFAADRALMRNPGEQVYEARVRSADGMERDVVFHKATFNKADGSLGGIIGVVWDITDRKRIEDAIRKSEEKYRDLVESTSDLVWEIDQNGRYTYVSPVAKPLLGYSPAELIGRTPFDIMDPTEAKRVAATFAPISAAHQPLSLLENTVLRKDGQEVVLETSATPIFDEGGIFCGYRGIDRDVTAHKLAEKALQRRDALLHAAATIASELVTASSIDDAIQRALELISEVMRVDRIVVFERPPTQAKATLRYLWEGPQITEKLDPAYFENPAAETTELMAWSAPLARGKIVMTDVRTATGGVKTRLDELGIKKKLMVPITVDGRYWGQIALDICDGDGAWEDYEVESLQTMAELFGTAIQRDRYLKELADANRIVQNTPTILYRMGGEPSLPMIYISQNIKLFGHDPAILTASPQLYRSLIDPDDLENVLESMAHALSGQTGVVEFRMLTSRGEFRWVENHYMPLLDKTGRVIEVEGLLSDISERKAAEEKIARLARTDSLTGLANRSTFTERLRELFAASRRGAPAFSLLYLDLDRFKDVNDTLGHPTGDRMLITVGERMQRCVRETDLVARIGGDEFAVLQTDLNETVDAGKLAEKLRAAIAETMLIGGNELHMTVSIGIAIYGADTVAPDDLLAHADLALYRAKEDGRDQYRFHTEELDIRVRDQVSIAEELRKAISHGEFELHYQPQVESSTNQIAGMEALVRWRHPKRGLLLPAQFIDIAERTGTITAIGQWVLESACRQMNIWRAAGVAPSTIAVNVSAVQLKTANEFVDLVQTTLQKWNLAPGALELDVTESTLARVALAQNDVLERLQKMGVKIAIDDFGMKYSSLDYLKTYHVNRIKVPRPLIDAAPRDRESAAITRAIVDIARELDIEVIAEGVESEVQWMFLTATAPVSKIQGYYYSKPVSVDDATALLKRRRIEPAGEAARADKN